MIHISDLKVSSEGKDIIKGLSLTCNKGELHVIMGPNGAGKSTLAKVIAGHPLYEVLGSIKVSGKEITSLDPEDRAKMGIFVGFQYPTEVSGITNIDFLREARSAISGKSVTDQEARKRLNPILDQLSISPSFLERNINDSFSGGEKKRNEILQMLYLDPSFIILDESDSGLDIDALRLISQGISSFLTPSKVVILITHYQRMLDYLLPTRVHVMKDGKLVNSGDASLAKRLDKEGYT